MKVFFSFFVLFFLTSSLLSQNATKQDIQILIKLMEKQSEQMDKRFEMMQQQNQILREDMNKRFEQVDKRFEQVDKRFEQVDKRFEDLFRFIGILYFINFAFLGYLWREIRKIETKKYDIAILEQQLYQAKPEIKARIYLHLKEEAEKYIQKTSHS